MPMGTSATSTPRKLKDPVATPSFSINLREVTSRVGTAQLPRDSQKEAMRLTALVDTLNAKIASQQSSLDAANASVATLKRQISTENAAAEREISRLRGELNMSKDNEVDLRSKISTVLKTNEAIKVQKVAPLQSQVASLEDKVADLSNKLAQKPQVVEAKADTGKLDALEKELGRVTAHRDALVSDVASLRLERNAAMDHVMSMTLTMETGCYHKESEEENEDTEDEEEEETQGRGGTRTGMVATNSTDIYEGADNPGGAKRCCGCTTPGTTHALSAIVHAGTAMGGTIPKRCPGHWPPLSQMHALTAASGAAEGTGQSAENNAHLTSLIRGVMNDLYSMAMRVQTTRMEQSGETKKAIENYFADIEKARNEAAAAAGA